MQKTMLLDQTAWDLVLDANGDIACAADPYSIAQDVASAVRTFLGECWYDTTQGIPYSQQILGESPPLSLVKSQVEAAAKTVPNVDTAECTIVTYTDRAITGRVEVTDSLGNTTTATF